MRKLCTSFVFFSVCGLILGQVGCRRLLTLSDTKLVFDEGKEETKSLDVTSGVARDVQADQDVVGVTAKIEGAAVRVTSTREARPGTYRFHVIPRRGKASVPFEVTITPATLLTQSSPPPQESQSFEPLVLEVDTLTVNQGQTGWINARSGAIDSACTDSTAELKVRPNTDCRKVEVLAAEDAAPGQYEMKVKGKDGKVSAVHVMVREVQTLIIEPHVEFNLDQDVTKTSKVARGIATAVRDTNVKGLSARVGSGGKTVEITAARDVPLGRHQVVVDGRRGTSYGIWVTVYK